MTEHATEAPARAITCGPRHHWFGYYDKLQFDPSARCVLGMEVDFEHRSPLAEDVIAVGMVDLAEGDRWIALGTTRAWCWQQGCMLQWRPGSESEVLWNDREGDHYITRVLDLSTGQMRTLPHPFYTISPDGRTAVAPDFRRINDMRPGYGYAGLPDPYAGELALEDAGIWRLDLESGAHELVVSLAEVVAIPYPHADLSAAKHWFNHLLFNTDGTRFEFLHRWRIPGQPGFGTRMLTAAPDGSAIHVVDDYGHTSHFIWRDPSHILAWAYHPSHEMAFYVYEDGTGEVQVVGGGVMTRNGHCTYLPGNEWILNDTYPDGERYQELYLYHVPTGDKVSLGRFYAPEAYTGEWRCDLHPRSSRDGRLVCVDAPDAGSGRQMVLVSIGELIGI